MDRTARLAGVRSRTPDCALNHFAISTSTQGEVDQAAAYLADKGIAHLFETPRHRPDFAQDETSTYYQVMFETPDRLLVEIVYTGPKS